jgi:F-type H+-transporting ATPase subunit delta
MPADAVAHRYAQALLEYIEPRGAALVDEVQAELNGLAGLVTGHDDLRGFLANPDVEVQDQVGGLVRVSGGKVSKDTEAFLRLALSMDRAAELVDIVGEFGRRIELSRQVVHVTVASARPLPPDLRQQLVERVAKQEGGKTVQLEERVQPELLGGIQVFVGHQVFDGSLRTQMNVLRERLKRVRVH